MLAQKNSDSIEEIAHFLEENTIQIISTISDNKPTSRPIGSARFLKGKIWYCMNNDKPFYTQLCANPSVCICVCAHDYVWLRLHADAVFSHDSDVKQFYINNSATRFQDVNDPRFSIFYLSHIVAEIHKGKDVRIFDIK